MSFIAEKDRYVVETNDLCDVVADGDKISSGLWFHTPALDKELIDKVVQIQLETKSHDQGYVSIPEAGSWSWFDIVVLDTPESIVPKVKDGLALVWLSHTNQLGKSEDSLQLGSILDSDHDIFHGLEAGNALAVRVSAQFPGWENHASEGRLILQLSEEGRRETQPVDDARVKYHKLVAKQISKLEEVFDQYLDISTPPDAPPAYSLVREMLPTGPLRADQETLADEAPLKLLSLDGGGVRGLSSLYILQGVMAKVSADPNVKPCKYFDMMAGTSTGGLIAIMLGRLQMAIPECINVYMDLASKIFSAGAAQRVWNKLHTGAYYGKEDFEKAMKDLIKKKTGDENAPMRDPDPNNRCKVFVVANRSQNLNHATAEQFRTYPTSFPDPFPNVPIWKAARATSAAPTYLPSITIDNVEFVDGGMRFNNPTILLMGEVNAVYAKDKGVDGGVGRRIDLLLTLGTGMQPNVTINKQPDGIIESGKYLVSLLEATKALVTDTETTNNLAKGLFYGKEDVIYFRFNAGVRKGDDWEKMIDLDDWEGMPKLVKLTKTYLDGQTKRLEECATALTSKD